MYVQSKTRVSIINFLFKYIYMRAERGYIVIYQSLNSSRKPMKEEEQSLVSSKSSIFALILDNLNNI